MTKQSEMICKSKMERLRKAIMSAASLLQEVPIDELPGEDTLDYITTDLRIAQAAVEDLQQFVCIE